MKPARIFISHSASDKDFATRVVRNLRDNTTDPWIDHEHIISGEDIFQSIGEALDTMDLFIVLFSKKALDSGWVREEVEQAKLLEIQKKRSLIMPFIIDNTSFRDLPWFLQKIHARSVSSDARGATDIVNDVLEALGRRGTTVTSDDVAPNRSVLNDQVSALIDGIGPGDWDKAYVAALEVLRRTDRFGHNEPFNSLVEYNLSVPTEEEYSWGAGETIEACIGLAPWLSSHDILFRMAQHQVFSVRSSAASICMKLANIAPDLVPIDVLTRLAVPDEDWYVEAPATAALKTLVGRQRDVLYVFFQRLHSSAADVREYAARALADIAREEPEILSATEIRKERQHLKKLKDKEAVSLLDDALTHLDGAKEKGAYKYGL
ncbi:MAG: hypothetical protein OJF49_001084 [Ktedonobacterales bacterium]|jgi:hypothetical protein|nr:MAG: hypothetical protein OJF49_001084 [Ktedonobacterales bacterium]